MTNYLTESEHDILRAQISAGDASIQISKEVARQFFTHVSNSSVQSTLGESITFKKLVIYAGIFLPIALLVATLGAILYLFGWGAAIGIPLTGAFWTIVAGLAGARGSWVHDAVGLAAGMGIAVVIPPEYSIPLAMFTTSLIMYRLNYLLAQVWLERLVARSFVAYDMLVEHIKVRDVGVQDAARV